MVKGRILLVRFFQDLERFLGDTFFPPTDQHDKLKYELQLEEHVGGTIVVVVIDVSGSMDLEDYPPSRLSGAIKAAGRFLQRSASVNPSQVVAIVAFSTKARLISPPLRVKGNLTRLKNALSGLSAGGFTNIPAGLKIGLFLESCGS
jgi:Mg-chelatase subunit ChlD